MTDLLHRRARELYLRAHLLSLGLEATTVTYAPEYVRWTVVLPLASPNSISELITRVQASGQYECQRVGWARGEATLIIYEREEAS